jgi:ribose/xylose/arabinose/galactoside ABC-type transport system permease subunit
MEVLVGAQPVVAVLEGIPVGPVQVVAEVVDMAELVGLVELEQLQHQERQTMVEVVVLELVVAVVLGETEQEMVPTEPVMVATVERVAGTPSDWL